MTDPGCRYNELAWRIRKLCKHYMRLGAPIPREEVAETLREDYSPSAQELREAAQEARRIAGAICDDCEHATASGCGVVLLARHILLTKETFNDEAPTEKCSGYETRKK